MVLAESASLAFDHPTLAIAVTAFVSLFVGYMAHRVDTRRVSVEASDKAMQMMLAALKAATEQIEAQDETITELKDALDELREENIKLRAEIYNLRYDLSGGRRHYDYERDTHERRDRPRRERGDADGE